MFRLQNNVPQYYIDNSRDFQLLCRLYDYINNGVRFDTRTIPNILDPLKINDRMLPLYSTKIGFFHNIYIDAELLRSILNIFPTIIKYKGSKKGIELAIGTILKVENTSGQYSVKIDTENFIVHIYTTVELYNKEVLDEVLKYVLPIGYTYDVQVAKTITHSTDALSSSDVVALLKAPLSNISQIIDDDRIIQPGQNANIFNFPNEIKQEFVGAFDTTEIIGPNNDTSTGDTSEMDRLESHRDSIDVSANIQTIGG